MCWGFYTHAYTLLFFFLWRFRPHTVCWPAFAHHKAGTPLSNVMIVPGLRKWHVGKSCVFLFTAFHAVLLYCLWDVKVGARTPLGTTTKACRQGAGSHWDGCFLWKNIFWPRNGPRHWWYTAFLLEKLPVCWEATGEWVITECKQPRVC